MKAVNVQITLDTKTPFSVDVKRFKIPGLQFSVSCPKCSTRLEHAPDYLSYPIANGIETVGLWCESCETDISFDIRLGITVEVTHEEN